MKHLTAQAERGKAELPQANLAIGAQVADLMLASGTSDDTCAAIIDVAGEVLRKHQLSWFGEKVNFILNPADHCALMRFKVDVSYKDASAMTMEAAQMLIEKNLDAAPFMIDFVGVKV